MKATLTTHRAGVASTGNYTTYTVAEAVELCRRHGLTRVHIQADFNGRVAILQGKRRMKPLGSMRKSRTALTM